MARSDRHPRTRLDPDARRASLLEAAAVEFAALPYAEVTIAAIARRADASMYEDKRRQHAGRNG